MTTTFFGFQLGKMTLEGEALITPVYPAIMPSLGGPGAPPEEAGVEILANGSPRQPILAGSHKRSLLCSVSLYS